MGDRFGGFMKLPIRRRGQFTKDDFFKDFQQDFDTAIEDVMDKYTGRSLLADQFSNYRKMRETSEDAGPAASVSETKDSCVIVLDMSDFVKGSISVRTRGQYAVVEADYESKTFNRKFLLPRNTNFDGVKTAMSNEGILTITAPKKCIGKTPQQASEEEKGATSLKVDAGMPEAENGGGETPSSSRFEDVRASASGANSEENVDIPLSPSMEDKILSISKKGNFFQDQYFQNVWKDFENAMGDMIQREEARKSKRQERRQGRKSLIDSLKNDMLFDAERKQHDFFRRTRDKESDLEARLGIPTYNRLNSYRNLRTWAPETDTQAVTVTQDERGYKIVMDVKNFGNGDGDVSVKASEGFLTVTGRKGDLKFCKEFTLKGLTNPDQVSASVSEDGILTITVDVSVSSKN